MRLTTGFEQMDHIYDKIKSSHQVKSQFINPVSPGRIFFLNKGLPKMP